MPYRKSNCSVWSHTIKLRKMSTKLVLRRSPRWILAWQAVAVFAWIPASNAVSQIVQLPTVGTFSLQTSVMAPDSGSVNLGGNRRYSGGSHSLGPGSQAFGATSTSASSLARATIIDLNELDLMIRSQSGSKPIVPDLVGNRSKPSQYAGGPKGTKLHSADYEYLAALTHQSKASPEPANSDTAYYLSLASNAKQLRHWASVELYYKLAWESLPEARRENVLQTLLVARIKAEAEVEKKPKTNVK